MRAMTKRTENCFDSILYKLLTIDVGAGRGTTLANLGTWAASPPGCPPCPGAHPGTYVPVWPNPRFSRK